VDHVHFEHKNLRAGWANVHAYVNGQLVSGQLRLVRKPEPQPSQPDVSAITDVFNDAIDEVFFPLSCSIFCGCARIRCLCNVRLTAAFFSGFCAGASGGVHHVFHLRGQNHDDDYNNTNTNNNKQYSKPSASLLRAVGLVVPSPLGDFTAFKALTCITQIQTTTVVETTPAPAKEGEEESIVSDIEDIIGEQVLMRACFKSASISRCHLPLNALDPSLCTRAYRGGGQSYNDSGQNRDHCPRRSRRNGSANDCGRGWHYSDAGRNDPGPSGDDSSRRRNDGGVFQFLVDMREK